MVHVNILPNYRYYRTITDILGHTFLWYSSIFICHPWSSLSHSRPADAIATDHWGAASAPLLHHFTTKLPTHTFACCDPQELCLLVEWLPSCLCHMRFAFCLMFYCRCSEASLALRYFYCFCCCSCYCSCCYLHWANSSRAVALHCGANMFKM